jgi:tetratricopeptide (TPR) repeat protein
MRGAMSRALVLLLLLTACPPQRIRSLGPAPGREALPEEGDKQNSTARPDEIRRVGGAPYEQRVSDAEMRASVWEIEFRRLKGEIGQARQDYVRKAVETNFIEWKLIAAWAHPNEEEGWQEMKQLTLVEPRFAWGYLGMAWVYVKWKIRDQAENEFARAQAANPQLAFIHTLKGEMLRRRGEIELADASYKTALGDDPTDAQARAGLGLVKVAMGDPKGARVDLEKGLSAVPTFYEAASALARILDDAGEVDKALVRYEQAVALQPRDREALLAIGRLREKKGELALAAEAYEKAGQLAAPDAKPDVALQRSVAGIYRKLGRRQKEIEALERLARLETTDPAPHRRLAQIYEEAGDDDRLQDAFKAILNVAGADAAASMGLARLALKRGVVKDALTYLADASAAGDKSAQEQLDKWKRDLYIATPPFASQKDVNVVYRKVFGALDKLYAVRRQDLPRLKGKLELKVSVGADGQATRVEIKDDTVGDERLLAGVYWNLRLAGYPPAVKSYTFKFELEPR